MVTMAELRRLNPGVGEIIIQPYVRPARIDFYMEGEDWGLGDVAKPPQKPRVPVIKAGPTSLVPRDPQADPIDIDIPYIPEIVEDIWEDPLNFLIREIGTGVHSFGQLVENVPKMLRGEQTDWQPPPNPNDPWDALTALPGSGQFGRGAKFLRAATAKILKPGGAVSTQLAGRGIQTTPRVFRAATRTGGAAGAGGVLAGTEWAESYVEGAFGLGQALQTRDRHQRTTARGDARGGDRRGRDTDMPEHYGMSGFTRRDASLVPDKDLLVYERINEYTGLLYGKTVDGRMVYQKKDGSVTIHRPEKPIVLTRNPRRRTVRRALRRLKSLAKTNKKYTFEA